MNIVKHCLDHSSIDIMAIDIAIGIQKNKKRVNDINRDKYSESWEIIKKLKLKLLSKGLITTEAFFKIYSSLSVTERTVIGLNICRIMTRYVNNNEFLSRINKNEMLHIIALGRNTLMKVVNNPEYYLYIKNDLQIIDISYIG